MDFDDLKYTHEVGCGSKDSKNVIHKNVYFDEISEVECDVYCNECGAFLYHFYYGHYES